MRDGVNLSGLPNGLITVKATLGVDEVRREDGVDERRLSQTSLACVHITKLSNASRGGFERD